GPGDRHPVGVVADQDAVVDGFAVAGVDDRDAAVIRRLLPRAAGNNLHVAGAAPEPRSHHVNVAIDRPLLRQFGAEYGHAAIVALDVAAPDRGSYGRASRLNAEAVGVGAARTDDAGIDDLDVARAG